MAKKFKVVLAQLNLKVGDIEGNLNKLIHSANIARDDHKADLVVFPELSIIGYASEDLLLRQSYLDAASQALDQFKTKVQGIHCLIGHPYQTTQGLFNSCSIIYNGTILGRYSKQYLPNYGIFDECRYFTPGNSPCVISINGVSVGILICEDLWHSAPAHQAGVLGARIILAPNASPFEINKHERRLETLTKRSKSANAPIIYVNCVGGQDELVFDGGSMIVDPAGKVFQHAGFFEEALLPVDIEISSAETIINTGSFTLPNEEKLIYDALVLGVKDYVHKNGFQGTIIGVSGGIDSALTLAIAVDALGKENVTAVYMPSRYNSPESERDARAVAKNLGLTLKVISIESVYNCFIESLALNTQKMTLTEQNIQSRCRGLILMALSNQTGHLILNTGNRSELAVGYCTIYGDMVGALGVLKDIPKTRVYRLAHYRNQIHPVIPNYTLERAPTAELAPNQKDDDTLPPYSVLDRILELYLNQSQSIDNIVSAGFDQEMVRKVVKMIKQSEYKRRQSPPGLRIEHKSFGRDWRYPITSGFKG